MNEKKYFVCIFFFFFIHGCSGDQAANPTNRAPQITSNAIVTADHNRPYSYVASATDADGDSISFSARHPSWLAFDSGTATLSGLATRENLGAHQITLSVSDGVNQVDQQFTLIVEIGEILCDSDFGDPNASAYILPYPVGKSYRVSQTYCHPTGGHKNTFAYDFDLAIGDTIVASRAGSVTFTNAQYADGDIASGHENNVFIRHADGTMVRYTHLRQNGVLVNVGEQVAQGQAIGISGNTGNTGNFPHLHFAVFHDNTDYGRKNTLPVNFSNSAGPMDQNKALIGGRVYLAQ